MFYFIMNAVLLGVGLAMDAFSISLANGLNEPKMKFTKMCKVAGVFGVFQTIMPLIGYLCVHTILRYFKLFEKFIPWIGFFLLLYIGGKMIYEGVHCEEEKVETLNTQTLILQGIATSIDALSVGFTIASYSLLKSFVSSFIIGIITFIICLGGLKIGKIFGTKLSQKSLILGGLILIFIGIEILVF